MTEDQQTDSITENDPRPDPIESQAVVDGQTSPSGQTRTSVSETINNDPTPISEVANAPAENENLPPPPTAPEDRSVLDFKLRFVEKGEKLKIDGSTITVNWKRFPHPSIALRSSSINAGYLKVVRDEMLRDKEKLKRIMESHPEEKDTVFKYRSLSLLKNSEPALAQTIGEITLEGLSLTAQFDLACEYYLLTGKNPTNFHPEVIKAFERLPVKEGRNILDSIADENNTLKLGCRQYQKRVKNIRDELGNITESQQETERGEYTPPPFSGESEPMDPSAIETKVYPFKKGYFRGQCFRYDPTLKCLVAVPVTKRTFNPTELPENLAELKRFLYEGKFDPSRLEHPLYLPFTNPPLHSALPLTVTVKPPDKLQIMRSENGNFSIELKEGESLSEKIDYSFEFVMAQTEDTLINDEPLESDLDVINGPLGEHAESLIASLQDQTTLSSADKSRSVVSSIRQNLMYPKEEQVEEMNQKHLESGENLMQSIGDSKIADCHWGNNYAAQICRRLDIKCRIPTGYFVKRDKRFDFSALAGIGHAWLEVWDEENRAWVKLDATPPKQPDDKKEEEEEDDESEADSADPTGEMGIDEEGKEVEAKEADDEQDSMTPLTEEQLEKFMKSVEESLPSPQKIQEAMFKERTGVDMKEWERVEKFIEETNKTKIPTESQISEQSIAPELKKFVTAEAGTLEREWQKLFCHICKRREYRQERFVGPVTQEEGQRLKFPAMATIDILRGSSNPMGYETIEPVRKQETFIKEFEEDALVDLTASMEQRDNFGNIIKIEQKKAILTMLYNLMKLNAKLNSTGVLGETVGRLREPLQLRSEIRSIRGSSTVSGGSHELLKSRDEDILEKAIIEVEKKLNTTVAGPGDFVSALVKYREALTQEILERIEAGKLVKMLTIYSDGNMWCAQCGQESCTVKMHVQTVLEVQKEVKKLRELGIIVQGIGFTQNAKAIKALCNDPKDPESAEVIDNVSGAVALRQKMLVKHLRGI